MSNKRMDKEDNNINTNEEMKSIYIVLSLTGTGASRLIKLYTREPYSHASIALDSELKEMYSFARRRIHNPFTAGFIKEEIDKGVFGVYKDTMCCVYRHEITASQYEIIKNEIEKFKENADQYTYSYLGVFYQILHKPRKSAYKYFCSQFVAYTLEKSGENLFDKRSEMVRPIDIRKCEKLDKIYEGRLTDYRKYTQQYV